jgi:hypothetical protein
MMDDYYDMSDNFLLHSNVTGGAAKSKSRKSKSVKSKSVKSKSRKKAKSTRKYSKSEVKKRRTAGLKKFQLFSKKYNAERKAAGQRPLTRHELSVKYHSKQCGKKGYTSEKLGRYCSTIKRSRKLPSKGCRGYTIRRKSMSKASSAALTKKCKGYTTKKRRKSRKGGDIFGGDAFGGYMCPECQGTGEGLYGGCSCCGGSGIMGGAIRSRSTKRCVSSKALLNRIHEIQALIRKSRQVGAPQSLINRLVGALRQMEVMYKRQVNVGSKFLTSSNFGYPGSSKWFDSDGYLVK